VPCPCHTNGGAAPKPPVAASQDAPRPVLCMDCLELVDRCTCAISDSRCEWCGIPIPLHIMDAHVTKCPKRRQKAAGAR